MADPAKATAPETEPDWRVTEALLSIALRWPAYLRLAVALVRDPRVPASARRWLVGAGLYNLSPIDPVPGIIPVLGQLDDYAVLLLAVRKALRASPAAVRDEHLAQSSITEAQIDTDLAEMRRIARHVTRGAARGAWAGLQFAVGVGTELGRQAAVGVARRLWPGSNNPGEPAKEEITPSRRSY
jgi:uncharacterized membrane protein YkvA (DUF1232 family)